MKIYKITSNETTDVYIGKTKQPLKIRLQKHRSNYRLWCNETYHFTTSYLIVCYDDAKIELIEETEDISRESYWIRKLDCCNKQGNREIKDYIYKNKDKTYTQGFYYRFQYNEDGKLLIRKKLVDYDKVLAFATEWFKENNIEFN